MRRFMFLVFVVLLGYTGAGWGIAHGQTAGPVPTVVSIVPEPTEIERQEPVISAGGENSENTPTLLGASGMVSYNSRLAFAAVMIIIVGFLLWYWTRRNRNS